MLLKFILSSAVVLAAVAVTQRVERDGEAGSVVTEELWSQALGVKKKVVVYLPPSYFTEAKRNTRYPVAYYLHGSWGDETDWTIKGHLNQTMDSLVQEGMREMIIVMPDGDDGWWTTWHSLPDIAACRKVWRAERDADYCVPWAKYDDYLTHDVIHFIDSAYRTIPERTSRGIAGLSMGGYGAIALAARYPMLFSVAVSHSGVMRPAMIADSSGLAAGGPVIWRDAVTDAERRRVTGTESNRITPAFGTDSIGFVTRDPATLMRRLKQSGQPVPVLMIDSGTEDASIIRQNRLFRQDMAALEIPVFYSEWGADHEWSFWRTRSVASLAFIGERLAAAATSAGR
jgi:enterochelin esterase-like enzyme